MKAHGDKCHPEQDVDGGEQHPHHVLLLLLATAKLEPGHPDGGEKGEAVVEGVHRVDTVVRGNSNGAEAEVDEEKEEAEPGRKDRKKERNKRERKEAIFASRQDDLSPRWHRSAFMFPVVSCDQAGIVERDMAG